MSKRKLVTFIAVALLAGALTVAGVVTVMANDNAAPSRQKADATSRSQVIALAAEELGVDPDDLARALRTAEDTAKGQRLDEMASRKLALVVEAGGISQEEADGILSWWLGRPAKVDPGLIGVARRPHVSPDLMLSPMVERGRLTEEEAAGIRTWWDARPEGRLGLVLTGPKRPGPQRGEHRPAMGPDHRDQMGNFDPKAVAGFNKDHLKNFYANAASGFGKDQMGNFDPKAVAGFSKDHLKNFESDP